MENDILPCLPDINVNSRGNCTVVFCLTHGVDQKDIHCVSLVFEKTRECSITAGFLQSKNLSVFIYTELNSNSCWLCSYVFGANRCTVN